MIEYVPVEMCQHTFSKIISEYYGSIYTEMQTKTPEEVTNLAKKLISEKLSQRLFQ